MTIGPTIIDRDILTLDEAGVVKAMLHDCNERRIGHWRTTAEQSDHRHWLLRARRERQRGCAAEQRDELAPFHSISSSAKPDSGSGTVRPSALAVFRFMTSVYLSARWMGRSPGFVPLRMRSTCCLLEL